MLMQYKVVPKILMDMNIKLKNTRTHYTSNQSWLEDFFFLLKKYSFRKYLFIVILITKI